MSVYNVQSDISETFSTEFACIHIIELLETQRTNQRAPSGLVTSVIRHHGYHQIGGYIRIHLYAGLKSYIFSSTCAKATVSERLYRLWMLGWRRLVSYRPDCAEFKEQLWRRTLMLTGTYPE